MKPSLIRTLALLFASLLISAGARAAPCSASATVLCLSGKRFAAEVRWKDFQAKTGQGQGVQLTPDTGYFWFFTDNNTELVVKVLDARAFNNKFWVFFGALSNVEYTLKVTDTVTGAIKEYQNPSGQFASVGDTAAFPGATTGVASTHETVTVEGTETPPQSLEAIQRFVEAAPAKPAPEASEKKAAAFTPCPGPSSSLFLSNCRFRLEVHWTDSQGNVGVGQAVQLTNDTGYFWFFTDNNVELIVKVLDARAFNGSFWVFYGALSNVEYSLHVQDTISGALHIYENGSGNFASVGDTSAFRGGYGVSVTLDSARAASSAITASIGGTLSATAADGTVFTLEIPPNALRSDKTITMTPVSSIGGLPFSGGLVAAVNLQPSGLYLMSDPMSDLMSAARLTIKAPSPIPQAEETPFAWNGSGEDFFRYPPVAVKGDLQMYIFHLGGYGVARGTDAEWQAQAGREPVGDDDRLSHNIAPFLRQGRTEAQSGRSVVILRMTTPEDWRQDSRSYFDRIYVEAGGLRDRMLGTVGYPDQVASIITDVMDWMGAVRSNLGSLEKAFPGRPSEILRLFEGMLRRALKIVRARCAADVTEIRQLPQLLSLIDIYGFDLSQEKAAALKCLTFQLKFDSTIVATGYTPKLQLSFAYTARASASLSYDGKAILGTGDISIADVSVTGVVAPCKASISTGSSVLAAEMDFSSDLDLAKAGRPADITLIYFTGSPESTVTVTCPDEPPWVFPYGWAYIYASFFHQNELYKGGSYRSVGWKQTGGKTPWATRSYAQSQVLGKTVYNETTFLKIDHTPQ